MVPPPVAESTVATALGRLVGLLGQPGDRRDEQVVLSDERGVLSGQELQERIAGRRAAFGSGRRLVRLTPAPTLDRVVDQLAALDAGHAVLLADDRQAAVLDAAWDPDTVVDDDGIRVVRDRPARELHPDLALLLSTSGSTGSPKLVRLSWRNIDSNARAIAEYLRLGADDVGITSLPLHYCYGLSVLHSHLVAGASVHLTETSMVDPCFWDAVERHGVTNLAGVPHSFELLERVGLERLGASSIRFVTQAGGRMAPDRVRELARRGERDGWELFVMYGQTEATARMAYLPPTDAVDHPDAVGLAIPGGALELRDVDSGAQVGPGEVGRVVYRGPNVMMGYATSPDDLARGPELDELVTGDLGRVDADGLLRIVGRESRFAKLYGVRIDLQRVEDLVAVDGREALAASDDQRLVVAVAGDGVDGAELRARLSSSTGLPVASIIVMEVDELPRLTTGKPDPRAVLTMAATEPEVAGARAFDADGSDTDDVVGTLYRRVLGVERVAPDDTFVSLGGDSLGYVEVSIRLEERLGSVPADWHLVPVGDLNALADASSRRGAGVFWARVDTTVVLRAVAIMLVVSSHMRWFYVPVGSHVLIAVAGYNFARFQLADTGRPGWLGSVATVFAKIAGISMAWIASQMLLFGGHGLGTVLLVNSYTGDLGTVGTAWRYWYIEAIVHIGIVLVALFAWPRVRAVERRWPFWFPVALLVPALVLRFEWVMLGSDPRNAIFQADTIVWLFLLGWVIRRATTGWQRAAATGLVLVSVPGYFWHDDRNARLVIGLLALAWVPWVPIPRLLQRTVGAIASASLAIYLTHYAVFPELDDHFADRWVFPLTIAFGVVAWWVSARVAAATTRAWRARRDSSVRPVGQDGADEQLDRVEDRPVAESSRL